MSGMDLNEAIDWLSNARDGSKTAEAASVLIAHLMAPCGCDGQITPDPLGALVVQPPTEGTPMADPYVKLPPPLPFEEADAQGLVVLGTCDWGSCHREAWGVRWSREAEEYLTVCYPCSRTSWKPPGGRAP